MHEGHRKRLRNRFVKYGFEGFEKHELIELCLTYSIPRRNTNDIAHRIMDKFGSLSAVFEAHENELLEIEGVGSKSALLIRLIKIVYQICQEDERNNSDEPMTKEKIYEYIKQKCVSKKPQVFLLELDATLNILYIHNIELITDFSEEDFKDIIKNAVKRFTRYVVFYQNYIPNPKQSKAYMDYVNKARYYFSLIDVEIIDCVILNDNECMSVLKYIIKKDEKNL